MATKICTKCRQEKTLEQFHKNKHGKFGRHSWCKQCFNAYHPKHLNPVDPELHRERNLKNRYNLTPVQVDEMYQLQKGLCQICGNELSNKYRIDHDHETGKPRGLLCHRCNLLIAGIDDRNFFEKALDYLKRHK